MYEIERKFRLRKEQWQPLEKLLTEQFGKPCELDLSDKIYLAAGKTFGTHRKGEPLMRVRSQNDETLFTFKRTVVETGNRIEHETHVSDSQAIEAILAELGWQLGITLQKERLEFSSATYSYALDDAADLGIFLEIEYLSPDDDPNAEAKLYAEAKRLGLNPEEQIEPKNYATLAWEAKNQ